mmetsp:Transcript_10660/g.40120  ORF Transcript_10660/g.40120 Transcript_10660/m.40120 type:complete len:219 (+) Transcript_10660:1538-2194(+)
MCVGASQATHRVPGAHGRSRLGRRRSALQVASESECDVEKRRKEKACDDAKRKESGGASFPVPQNQSACRKARHTCQGHRREGIALRQRDHAGHRIRVGSFGVFPKGIHEKIRVTRCGLHGGSFLDALEHGRESRVRLWGKHLISFVVPQGRDHAKKKWGDRDLRRAQAVAQHVWPVAARVEVLHRRHQAVNLLLGTPYCCWVSALAQDIECGGLELG